MALFDRETTKLAWQIKKEHQLPWGEAFRLAMKAVQLPEAGVKHHSSFFGVWHPSSVEAVAGHFWGLSKAYGEISDTGRSIAMLKVAKALYGMASMMETVSLSSLKREKFFGESVMQEAFDYFVASATAGHTPRTLDLVVNKGAWEYSRKVKPATWHFAR